MEAMKVYGRGELQAAILIEQMRREGFEMCISKPEVLVRKRAGRRSPTSWPPMDFPDTFGVVTEDESSKRPWWNETGWLESCSHRVSRAQRGLIGFRGEYLNDLEARAS